MARHLGVRDTRGWTVEDWRLLTQPRHQPFLPGSGLMEQQLGVVAVTQLSQADDDGRQTEDDVQEADDDEDGVDQHGGLLPLLALSEGSVGVPGQPRGRVDDHRDGGQEGGEAGEEEEDDVGPRGSRPH